MPLEDLENLAASFAESSWPLFCNCRPDMYSHTGRLCASTSRGTLKFDNRKLNVPQWLKVTHHVTMTLAYGEKSAPRALTSRHMHCPLLEKAPAGPQSLMFVVHTR